MFSSRIYENPTVDLSIKYSNLIKTMLVTAFYAYELPVIVLFGLGNIFLTYWIEKVSKNLKFFPLYFFSIY